MKLLSFAAIALLIPMTLTSCGSGDSDKQGNDSSKNVSGAQQGDAFASEINIRYVDMDSLYKHYDYAVEQQAVLEQIALELQQYENQLGRNLQTKGALIEQKRQSNGYINESAYNADVAELQNQAQASQAQYARRAQADEKRVYEINKSIQEAIRDFVIEYNKEHKYDAIIHKEAGLYFNPALDITGELVDGLNKAYAEKKAKETADKAADKKK